MKNEIITQDVKVQIYLGFIVSGDNWVVKSAAVTFHVITLYIHHFSHNLREKSKFSGSSFSNENIFFFDSKLNIFVNCWLGHNKTFEDSLENSDLYFSPFSYIL